MYAMKNGFWYSQRTISAFVQCLFPAPANHAWFPFENPSTVFSLSAHSLAISITE